MSNLITLETVWCTNDLNLINWYSIVPTCDLEESFIQNEFSTKKVELEGDWHRKCSEWYYPLIVQWRERSCKIISFKMFMCNFHQAPWLHPNINNAFFILCTKWFLILSHFNLYFNSSWSLCSMKSDHSHLKPSSWFSHHEKKTMCLSHYQCPNSSASQLTMVSSLLFPTDFVPMFKYCTLNILILSLVLCALKTMQDYLHIDKNKHHSPAACL